MLPTSTAAKPAGYVMDAWGGLHPFGAAPKITQGGYWPGWDIARDVVANPNGPGGWVLDGWGGIHPFNGAPNVAASGFWNGWDIARGLTMYNGPKGLAGYVLDGWGGIHPVNNAAGADRHEGVAVPGLRPLPDTDAVVRPVRGFTRRVAASLPGSSASLPGLHADSWKAAREGPGSSWTGSHCR